MKVKNTKLQIEINGQKNEGYIIKLPPKQIPNDFFVTAEELEALFKLLNKMYRSRNELAKYNNYYRV